MNSLQLTQMETRRSIDRLEHVLSETECATTDFAEYTFHHFGEGTYVRELRLPANTVLVGAEHRMPEVCILTKGVMIIQSDGLETSMVYQAPYTFIAQPGKKAGYTLENSIFMTVHPNPNNIRDIAELERLITIPESTILEVVK